MAYQAISTDRQIISQNVASSRVLKTSEVEKADKFFLFHFKGTRQNEGHKCGVGGGKYGLSS
jgi:hypothetical protein